VPRRCASPPSGSNSDAAAVAALLGEIDGLLAEVNVLAGAASPELAPALGACRNALVKEAIDFSEVAQRYVPAEPAQPVVRAPTHTKVPAARKLSSERVPVANIEGESGGSSSGKWILLGLIAAAAAAYHGWNLVAGAPVPAGPPTFAGMPSNTMGSQSADGKSRTLQAKPGEKLDPEVVRKFVESEQLSGRVVVEVAPGFYVSTPAPAGTGTKEHP
jgi:hypothetical protein